MTAMRSKTFASALNRNLLRHGIYIQAVAASRGINFYALIFQLWRKTERKSCVFLSKNFEMFNKSVDVHLDIQDTF